MSSTAPVRAWTDDEGRARARSLLDRTFTDDDAVIASAPGRVNLIGEHTDYNDGFSLPIALPHRTFVALRPRDDGEIHLVSESAEGIWRSSLSQVRPGAVSGWGSYVAGVAWALAQEGVPLPGFEAAVASCVPVGAGLSSSAALSCATVLALTKLGRWDGPDPNTDSGRAWAARVCVRAENEIAGAPTGGMDQAAVLRCTAGHALLLDNRSGQVQHIPFDLPGAGLELLVIDTRAEHALVDGQYALRRRSCETAARILAVPSLRELTPADLPAARDRLPDQVTLARVRHVVTENARVGEFVALLHHQAWEQIGALLDASHTSLATDYEVSSPELDLAVRTARQAGALGARMTGAGFGGSAIALIRRGSAARVSAAVSAAFTGAGYLAPAFLIAEASAAAR